LPFPFPLPVSSYALGPEAAPAGGITCALFEGDVGPDPKVGGDVVVCNNAGGLDCDVDDLALSPPAPPPRPPGPARLNISGLIVRESARLLLLKLCGDVANPAAGGADVP